MDDPATLPTDGTASQSSLFNRLFNVFAAPGEVFEEVRTSPYSTANWLVPAVLYMLIGWVCSAIIFSQPVIKQQLSDITSQAIDKQMAARNVSKEQAEQGRQAAEKIGGIMTGVSMVAMPVLGGFGLPFWGGFLVWLMAKAIRKSPVEYMKAVEIAGLTLMIAVLGAIVKSLLIVGMGNIFATPSLVLLVKTFDPQNTLHSLLALVNVMTFWLLAVRASGLSKLTGASFGQAAAWMFGVWLALMALVIGVGAGFRAISKAAIGG